MRHLIIALLCASALALTDDSSSAPGRVDTKPQLKPEKKEPPMLGVVTGAGLGLSKLSPVKAYTVIRPYLKNPMAMPKKMLAFVGLILVSFYMLLNALTSFVSLMASPQTNVMYLCASSASFHAALFALRGPQPQFQWLTTADRLPFTMLSFLSFVVALREAVSYTHLTLPTIPLV